MDNHVQINRTVISLVKGDITDLDIECFVYYAQHSLVLGSGYGNAISMRGGPTVQEELKTLGHVGTADVVLTSAGEMKSRYIIHAVGPRFQEEDLENKLRATIRNVLACAEEKGIRRVAFPAMGCGFYGVPLDLSARIMFEVFNNHVSGKTSIKEIVICLLDSREYKPFQEQLASLKPVEIL